MPGEEDGSTSSVADDKAVEKVEETTSTETKKVDGEAGDTKAAPLAMIGDDAGDTKDEKPADDKKGDGESKDDKPIEYNLSLPENAALDDSAVATVTEFAQKNKLSPEAAQAVLEFSNTVVAERENAYNESIKPGGAKWTENVETWKAATLKDPEIGGSTDKVNASVLAATAAIKEFAKEEAPAVLEFLKETGMAANPVIIKMFARINKAMSEGTPPKGAPAETKEEKPMSERLYGKTPKPSAG